MAIESIGPKMMVQSATEIAKDASAIGKRGDMLQNAAAQQVQNEAERMMDEIVDIYEPEQARIQREREREQQQKKKKGEEAEEEQEAGGEKPKRPAPLPEVRQAYKKIDIRI